MKTINRVLLVAVLAVASTLANRASAQFKVQTDDGIAASPKVRQSLNERKAAPVAAASAVTAATYKASSTPGIAASPKVAQMLAERKAVANVGTDASTTQVENDGIAASPKVRAQMRERSAQFQIAPIK